VGIEKCVDGSIDPLQFSVAHARECSAPKLTVANPCLRP
jgi:hypothetical protein